MPCPLPVTLPLSFTPNENDTVRKTLNGLDLFSTQNESCANTIENAQYMLSTIISICISSNSSTNSSRSSNNLLSARIRGYTVVTELPRWWVLSRGEARSYVHFRSLWHQDWKVDLLEARL